MSPLQQRPAFLRYGAAMVALILATLLRLWIDPIVADSVPFPTYFLAIMFAAWYGGFGPSLLTLIVGGVVADYLRDGIYELRVRHRSVNYRMLYFFHDQIAVVSHGLKKEDVVPDREIDLAMSRSTQFGQDPERHTYKETTDG